LAGLRLVEFAGIGPGPFACMLMADMGADIVRIDRPGGVDRYADGIVARGRKTVVLDLKSPEGMNAALDLVVRADALVEGFRPGVMERLGLGPEVVLARNSRLVYGRMTGWGQVGPLAHAAGHDINYIAITGALSAIGVRDRPMPPLNLVGDYGGGALYLVTGVLAALLSAARTGQGQVVDAAICDGAASLMSTVHDLAARDEWSDHRESNMLDGGAPYYRTFECSDGKHVAVGAIEPKFYELLCVEAGIETGDVDERDDVRRRPALHARLESVFRTRSRDDWARTFEGSDACVAPVLMPSEAMSHHHMVSRGSYLVVDGVAQPAPAPRFSGTPSRVGVKPQSVSAAEAITAWGRRPG
jgi:alpha-methylacyl-CoA racemase